MIPRSIFELYHTAERHGINVKRKL